MVIMSTTCALLPCRSGLAGQYATTSVKATGKRPNIVVILTDDQGYWDLHCHGNEKIDTPHLDQLASESVRFDRFYVQPVCAPTRAGLLTGRYYLRTGLYNTRFGGDSLGLGEVTIAQMVKQLGY